MVNTSSITRIVILVSGFLLAIVLGNMLVTDLTSALLWIGLVSVTTACIFMGRRIWLLIPFMGVMDILVRVPGQPSTLLIAQILVLTFGAGLFLMRKIPYRFAWTELEFWVLVLSLFVAQAYIRNPVGVNILGGTTVGGKPYFLYALTMSTMIILASLRVPPKDLKLIFKATVIGGLISTGIFICGLFIPSIGFYLGGEYTRSDEVNYENFGTAVDTGAAKRITFLGAFSKNLSLWVCCLISPLKAFLHPLWAFLVLFSIGAAAYSGYRSVLATVFLTYMIGLCYRGGFGHLFLSSIAVVGLVFFLAIVNLIAPLPPNIQRSLTFLPGTWEQRYKDDAKGSSDWRYEMWKEVLISDKYIQNKWLGDGLGFTSQQLRQSMAVTGNAAGRSGFDQHRENILISGDYHSGPVQTIRVIGYIGLLFMLLGMFRLAVHAHRQILRCRGTEWFPLALLIGIPLMVSPIIFTFVFGDFKSGATTFLIGVGMVRMLQNNLPLPAYVGRSRTPYMLSSSHRNAPRVAREFSSDRAR